MPLTTAGRDEIASLITGAGTPFNTANSHVGVGNSTTVFDASHTDLQAATDKLRKVVDSAPSVTANSIEFVATFGTADANWVWNEWGVFNDPTAGTMLTRKVENLGEKTSAQTWVATVTLTVTIGA